ncbi:hypothetical protein KY317_01960 [Candidatus Woesearchaeota archaeon]|nr:hypothetical protein [Candidatus Woesearchaeota archaeon]
MDNYKISMEKARKNFHIADHMLSVTYPLIKDTKLLLAIIENIFLSMTNAMAAVLSLERTYKRVPSFSETFEGKMNVFREKIADQHGVNREFITNMQEIKSIILEHKKSQMEFARKGRFVICSDNYRLRTLGIPEIKIYLSKAKLFIQEMDNIIKKNEGLSK